MNSIQPVKFKAELDIKLKFKIQAHQLKLPFFTETGKYGSSKNKNLDFSYWAEVHFEDMF